MTGHVGSKSDHGMTTSKETGTCNSSEWNFAKKELGKGFLVCCFLFCFTELRRNPRLCACEKHTLSLSLDFQKNILIQFPGTLISSEPSKHGFNLTFTER